MDTPHIHLFRFIITRSGNISRMSTGNQVKRNISSVVVDSCLNGSSNSIITSSNPIIHERHHHRDPQGFIPYNINEKKRTHTG